MPSCSICIDDLKCPVSLPCGHIFCRDCILRAVNAINPPTPIHFCPTCRSNYAISNIDPSLIPSHLRLHVAPSIRRVYLDEKNPHIDMSMSHRSAISECARLQAENNALKVNCALWRKRAEVHAGATLGLISLVRGARDHALKWKTEKEGLERQMNILKRRLDVIGHGSNDIFPPIPPVAQIKLPSPEAELICLESGIPPHRNDLDSVSKSQDGSERAAKRLKTENNASKPSLDCCKIAYSEKPPRRSPRRTLTQR